MRKGTKRTVKIIRPERKEARDEGPRLIPLAEVKPSDSRLEHYMILAEIALKKKDAKNELKEDTNDER